MLERQRFFVRERVAFLTLTDTYDILDPETQQPVGLAVEKLGSAASYARVLLGKRLVATHVEVRELPDESLVFTIRKPFGLWRTRVDVVDAEDELVGWFQGKVWSWTSGFWVHDRGGQRFAEVRGNWSGWDFQFRTPDGRELGVITKKWAGLVHEVFTSANDNYLVSIDASLHDQPFAKMLLLAAALTIDIVLHEHRH